MKDKDKTLWAKILELVNLPKMKDRLGDDYHSKKRPPGGVFNACELYTDPGLDLSEREVMTYLNALVREGRLRIKNGSFQIVR